MTDHSEGRQLEAFQGGMRQLLYVFSHDMRNPLVNMKALLSELRASFQDIGEAENGPDGLQKERLETLQLLEQSVEQLDRLIFDANDIYHCMFDDLEPEEVALQELAERVAARFDDRSGVGFSIGRLPSVWADPLAMSRVIELLFEHAVQALRGDDGVVSITAGRDGANDLVVVSDTGRGMSDEELSRVFEPFRSHSAGAGLAVAKALIEAHGGRVWCESGPEKGSVFYISLPQRKSPG